jgi:hypothetical protein
LLADDSIFRARVLGDKPPRATLANGEPLKFPGFHVVETETNHWVENLTSLGACGAHLFLGLVGEHARQGHRLLPLVQVAEADSAVALDGIARNDVDLVLPANDSESARAALQELVRAVASREITPHAVAEAQTDFQITRGYLGVTT